MSRLPTLAVTDPEIAGLIEKEEWRQDRSIRLIPSENYASRSVMEATGSILTNKYSEGYPGKRYYEGQEFIDQIEQLAVARAKALFGAEHANVQPYSGSPANQAVYLALVKPGDTVMGLSLPFGGHLTHGWNVNFSGIQYRSVQYAVDPVTHLIEFFRATVHDAMLPSPEVTLFAVGSAVVMFVIGFVIFARYEREFVLFV